MCIGCVVMLCVCFGCVFGCVVMLCVFGCVVMWVCGVCGANEGIPLLYINSILQGW